MAPDQLTLDGSPEEPLADVQARRRAEANAAKDEAIQRVGANADQEWRRRALDAVRRLAEIGRPFTADDVWDRVGAPHEPRALGAVMQDAKRRRIAFPTSEYRPSIRI